MKSYHSRTMRPSQQYYANTDFLDANYAECCPVADILLAHDIAIADGAGRVSTDDNVACWGRSIDGGLPNLVFASHDLR